MKRKSVCFLSVLLFAAPCFAETNPAAEAKGLADLKPAIAKVVRDNSLPGKPVIALDIGGQGATDETIRRLAVFTHLKTLTIQWAPLSAKGFQHLTALTALEDLTVTFISLHKHKSAFVCFLKLPNLHSLNLSVTEITDADLEHLKGLKNLRKLTLDRETSTDRGVAKLQKALPDLKIDRGNDNTADKRMRKHFGIPTSKYITEEEVRSAILKDLPLGSSPDQVYAFLKKRGVGNGGFSSFYPLDKKGAIVCRVGFDPKSGYIVHAHYCLIFKMDQEKKLKDVGLKTWYTGP